VKTFLKIVLVVMLLTAALATAKFLLFAWPYLQPAPISDEEIAATVAEIEAFAHAMETRPKVDREALAAVFEAETGWLEVFDEWPKDGCPTYAAQPSEVFSENLENLNRLNASLDGILAGGLVLQQEVAYDAEMISFLPVRQVLRWQAAQTAWGEDPVASFDRSMALSNGLLEADFLFGAMMGLVTEDVAFTGLLHVLPRLTVEQRAVVAERIKQAPSPRAAVVDSFRAEAATLLDVHTRPIGLSLENKGHGDAVINFLMSRSGYRERERKWFVFFVRDYFDRAERWATAGGNEKAPEGDPQFFEHSLLGAIMVPNFPAFLEKGAEQARRRAAVLQAIRVLDANPDAPGNYELVYDDRRKIVLKPEYGCLEDVTPREQ
jgi:hypothetical protein